MFKRKLFAWILMIAVMLSLCPAGFAEKGTADGSEVSDNSTNAVRIKRIHIYTVEQLQEYALECKMDSFSENTVIYLEASLDLDKEPFYPFPSFSGTFEGNGHTISGFVNAEDGSNEGMFRYIEKSGIVRDLNVIGTEASNEGKTEIGGIAGTNYGLIENCSFTGIVSGKTMVGGICGSNYGRLVNCRCNGTVSGKTMVGGICGYNDGSVYSCWNKAKVNPKVWQNDGEDKDLISSVTENSKLDIASNIISANNANTTTDVGGICGYSDYIIYICTNYGTIGYPHYGYNVGGIVGRQSNFVSKCTNYGAVYGRNDVGGIVGQNEPYMNLTDRKSMSSEIQSLSDTFDYATSTLSANVAAASEIMDDLGENTSVAFSATNDALNDTGKLDKLEKDMERDLGISADLSDMSDVKISRHEYEVDEATDVLGTAEKVIDGTKKAVADADIDYSNIDKDAKSYTKGVAKDITSSYIDNSIESGDSFNAVKDTVSDMGIDVDNSEVANKVKDKATESLGDETVEHINNSEMTAEDYEKLMTTGAKAGTDWVSTRRTERKAKKQAEQDLLIDDLTVGGKAVVKIGEDYNALGKNLQTTVSNLSANFKEVNTHFTNVMNMLADALAGSLNVEIMKDMSELSDSESMFGTVTGSANYGEVDGDECVGGIAGAMGIESDFDLNGLITDGLASNGIFSNTYETTCIVRACENNGTVNAKHDNTGGIVGKQDIGLIITSENYGDVGGTGNNYGGVVGLSYSTVNTCYSKCTVSGTDYVGGIAGSGSIIYDCMSLSTVPENDGTFVGAIAGYADMDAERSVEIESGISADAFNIVSGNKDKESPYTFINEKCVSGNVFVNDELGGVKGISYTYLAEPISYKTAMDYSELPEKLRKWEITFKAEGKVIDTVEFEYGGKLSELPEVPEKDGYSGFWEDFDSENLTASRVVNAVYVQNGNAVEGNAVRDNGLCVVLVEGAVHSESAVDVTFPEDVVQEKINGKKIAEAITVELKGSKSDDAEYLIHYSPIKSSARTIFVLNEEGQWHRVKTEKQGSYLVFHASAPVTFAAVSTTQMICIVLISVAALLSFAGAYVLYRKKKSLKQAK